MVWRRDDSSVILREFLEVTKRVAREQISGE